MKSKTDRSRGTSHPCRVNRVLPGWVVGLGWLAAAAGVHAAVTVINTPPTSVRVFEKYEVQFLVTTSAANPFFAYDAAPPAGVTAGIGITVDGIFYNASTGHTFLQPDSS